MQKPGDFEVMKLNTFAAGVPLLFMALAVAATEAAANANAWKADMCARAMAKKSRSTILSNGKQFARFEWQIADCFGRVFKAERESETLIAFDYLFVTSRGGYVSNPSGAAKGRSDTPLNTKAFRIWFKPSTSGQFVFSGYQAFEFISDLYRSVGETALLREDDMYAGKGFMNVNELAAFGALVGIKPGKNCAAGDSRLVDCWPKRE